ncbi:MAG TPA: MlaA family lipoprotein [Sphingorhabdus sp.]|nr:MlaA family lipoprotein [Sphingorhabdus sp.]
MGAPLLSAALLLSGTPPVVEPVAEVAPVEMPQIAASVDPAPADGVPMNEQPVDLSELEPLPPATPPEPIENEIIVTARTADPRDPAEAINVEAFQLVQGADAALVAPVAEAYEEAVPSPIRKGIGNFLNNLLEPIAALNFLLQLKPGKAAETLGRFAINTTFGVGGLVDVAKTKPFNLPRRPNGFSNTLGFYGVKPGPYFFLPLIGPTTLRDLIGGGIDGLIYPMAIGKPFTQLHYTLPAGTLSSLNSRIANDCEFRALNEETSDPYAATRDYYLWRRQAQIDELKGREPAPLPVGTVAKCKAGSSPASVSWQTFSQPESRD